MKYDTMLIEFNAGKTISRVCWKLPTRQRVIKLNEDKKSFSFGGLVNQEIHINDDNLDIELLTAWNDTLDDWVIIA